MSYNKQRGAGYLVQVMETFAEDDSPSESENARCQPDLITHVAVGKMTVHDKDALEPALKDTEHRGVKPKQLLADSHYGSNDCLAKGKQRGVEARPTRTLGKIGWREKTSHAKKGAFPQV